ncbi:MAG: hypothetical protein CL832_10585 [Crocinitomicaceae bacterium]|nr:hypothetical protein [Crocinitomicaceae bacterium]
MRVKLNVIRIQTLNFWAIVIFSGGLAAQTEAKVNLATLPLLIPNVGLEVSLGDKQSFQLDVLGSFWNEQPLLDDTPFHVNQVFLEYRWYQHIDTQKWFIGPHIGFGMFTLQKPDFAIIYDYWEDITDTEKRLEVPDDEYQSGRVAFYGLTVGYKKRLKKGFGLEFFIGAGLTQSWYRGYKGLRRVDLDSPDETVYRSFNGSGEVVAYRGGLMLTYKIPIFATKIKLDE